MLVPGLNLPSPMPPLHTRSLGSAYFRLFLKTAGSSWAKRHVAGHIALSGAPREGTPCGARMQAGSSAWRGRGRPLNEREAHACKDWQVCARAGTWAGSLWPPLAIVAGGTDLESRGLNPVVPRLDQTSLESLLRHMPVLPFLSPAPAVFGDHVLVHDATSGQHYSAGSLGAWLRASGAEQASRRVLHSRRGWWGRHRCAAGSPAGTDSPGCPWLQAADAWERSLALMESGGLPPVETYCLFGMGEAALPPPAFACPA